MKKNNMGNVFLIFGGVCLAFIAIVRNWTIEISEIATILCCVLGFVFLCLSIYYNVKNIKQNKEEEE